MATHWTDPRSQFFKLITRKEGATAKELAKAMGRQYAPGKQQLVPIARRFEFRYVNPKPNDEGYLVYRFEKKADRAKRASAAKNAPKAAAAKTRTERRHGSKTQT